MEELERGAAVQIVDVRTHVPPLPLRREHVSRVQPARIAVVLDLVRDRPRRRAGIGRRHVDLPVVERLRLVRDVASTHATATKELRGRSIGLSRIPLADSASAGSRPV